MVDVLMRSDGLRASEEGIWLDQLCINQENEMDKKIHVGAMDMIYRSARRVVILLEDIQLTEDEERAGLAYATFYAEGCDEIKKRNLTGREKEEFVDGLFSRKEKEYQDRNEGHVLAAVETFALKLLGARWFSRAWCAHESRMAPYLPPNNPLILCYGRRCEVVSFEFRFIHYLSYYFAFFIPEKEQHQPDLRFQYSMNDPDPASLQQRACRIQRFMNLERPDLSSMEHLVNVPSSGCSRKGDLISIALNTSGIPIYYEGNVAVMGDVIWIYSLLVLATGDIMPLVVEGSKLRIPDGNGDRKEIVSWAINPHQGLLGESLPITDPSLITGVTRDYIELDLLIFKSLPSTPSQESLDLASRIITRHKFVVLAQEFLMAADPQVRRIVKTMGYDPGNDKPGLFTRYHQVWLAQASDCGLEWILRLPNVLEMGTNQTWMYGSMGVDADARLTEAASALLSHFSGQKAEGDSTSTSEQIPTVVRFFMCLLDPRLVLLNMVPCRLPAGPGDFAFTEPVSYRSYIAVPGAIAHLPLWQTRAWIIEPFDDDSTTDTATTSDDADMRGWPDEQHTAWRLRRRQIIYGCQPFQQPVAADGDSITLRKKQRVYGAEDYVLEEVPDDPTLTLRAMGWSALGIAISVFGWVLFFN
jgi:hypothetical protein